MACLMRKIRIVKSLQKAEFHQYIKNQAIGESTGLPKQRVSVPTKPMKHLAKCLFDTITKNFYLADRMEIFYGLW